MRKETEEFVERVNESLNTYGKAYTCRNFDKLFEDGEQAATTDASVNQQSTTPNAEAQKMFTDFENVFKTIQQFCQTYQNSPIKDEMLKFFNPAKEFGENLKKQAEQANQQNATPQDASVNAQQGAQQDASTNTTQTTQTNTQQTAPAQTAQQAPQQAQVQNNTNS